MYVADVLRSDRSTDGGLSLQVGDVVTNDADAAEVEVWQTVGFASRPPQSTAGTSAAQSVVIRGSMRDVSIAMRDGRTFSMYGSLGDGETAIYGAGSDGNSQGRILIKDDGSVNTVTTEGNAANGTTIMHTVGPDGLTVTTPWGSIVISSSGITMWTQDGTTQKAVIEMKRSSSEIVMTASTVKIQASNILLGVGATAATPVLTGQSGYTAIPSLSVFSSV
jgi:hypothetical protein